MIGLMHRLMNPSAANTSNNSLGNLLSCPQVQFVHVVVSNQVKNNNSGSETTQCSTSSLPIW